MSDLPQADQADITVTVDGGNVVAVEAPPGLSVIVNDYDTQGNTAPLYLDNAGKECVQRWIVEPGAANADERAPKSKQERELIECLWMFPPSFRTRLLICSSAHITGRDAELLKDASGYGAAMHPEHLATWPPVWEKNNPDGSGGWFVATTDEDLAKQPVIMAGASPALRQLWKDAQAAGFERIELDQDAAEMPGRETFEW